MPLYIIVWRQYGDWKVTMPFTTKEIAEKHIAMYLKKEHDEDVQIMEITPKDSR